MQFTKQETATVLAALRYFQENAYNHADAKGNRTPTIPSRLMGHFTEDDPVPFVEIDSLCERINTDEETAQGYSETDIRNADAEEIENMYEDEPPLTDAEIRDVFDRLAFDEAATEAAHERMMDIIDDVRHERAMKGA